MTDGPIPLLTEKDLSSWLGISLPSLQRMRSRGTGPRFVRLSERRIAYRRSDVDAWLARVSRIASMRRRAPNLEDLHNGGARLGRSSR
jgi:predicted DNA-binding transcriptional regulator AlpA